MLIRLDEHDIDDMLDLVHLVGRILAHSIDPFACSFAVAGNGPFQRFNGRNASSVHCESLDSYGAVRISLNMKVREILYDRIVKAHLAFRGKNAACKSRGRLAHGRDAENSFAINGKILLDRALAHAVIIY